MSSLSEQIRRTGNKLLDVLIEPSAAEALTKAEKEIERALDHTQKGALRLNAFTDELSYQATLPYTPPGSFSQPL